MCLPAYSYNKRHAWTGQFWGPWRGQWVSQRAACRISNVFDDMNVHLVNGTVLDVPVRAVVRAGGRSRLIDLPGEARLIKKIVFRYRSVGGGSKGRAEVVVWGNKP